MLPIYAAASVEGKQRRRGCCYLDGWGRGFMGKPARVIGTLLASLLLFGSVASGAHAVQQSTAPGKKYSSCKALWKKYPWGVAEDRAAARDAMDEGFTRPDVSGKVYRANWRRLDDNYNQVICERVTRQQAEEYLGNLFEEALCEKARVEGSELGPECAKYGYGIR